jgi:hypothetical protein
VSVSSKIFPEVIPPEENGRRGKKEGGREGGEGEG